MEWQHVHEGRDEVEFPNGIRAAVSYDDPFFFWWVWKGDVTLGSGSSPSLEEAKSRAEFVYRLWAEEAERSPLVQAYLDGLVETPFVLGDAKPAYQSLMVGRRPVRRYQRQR